MTKRTDSLLCHLEWVLCLLPEEERRAERDSLFFKNCLLDATDLSFLPLVYPDKLQYFFTQALSQPGSYSTLVFLFLSRIISKYSCMI